MRCSFPKSIRAVSQSNQFEREKVNIFPTPAKRKEDPQSGASNTQCHNMPSCPTCQAKRAHLLRTSTLRQLPLLLLNDVDTVRPLDPNEGLLLEGSPRFPPRLRGHRSLHHDVFRVQPDEIIDDDRLLRLGRRRHSLPPAHEKRLGVLVVDAHAGVLDEQVLQGGRLHDDGAGGGEARRRGYEPRLLHGVGVQGGGRAGPGQQARERRGRAGAAALLLGVVGTREELVVGVDQRADLRVAFAVPPGAPVHQHPVVILGQNRDQSCVDLVDSGARRGLLFGCVRRCSQ